MKQYSSGYGNQGGGWGNQNPWDNNSGGGNWGNQGYGDQGGGWGQNNFGSGYQQGFSGGPVRGGGQYNSRQNTQPYGGQLTLTHFYDIFLFDQGKHFKTLFC